jgi:predicted transcriptional regulator
MKNGVSRHTVIKKNSQDGFIVDLVKYPIHEKSIMLIHIMYTFNIYKETIRLYEAVRTKAV